MLASKVRAQLVEELDCPLHRIVLWTDSTITLGYIRNTTRRFKPFVANRLATIHELSKPEEWRHMPTKSNPADLASRGISANDDLNLERWLRGPEFLQWEEHRWPKERACPPIPADDPNMKATVTLTDAHVDVMDQFCLRFSTWERAVRSVAWWRRFCSIIRKTDEKASGLLSVAEFETAERALLRSTQKRYFSRKMVDLEAKWHVNRASPLIAFDPQLKEELLCTGSRLRFADNAASPILLPYKDATTMFIICRERGLGC
jgi:hypothetical protein